MRCLISDIIINLIGTWTVDFDTGAASLDGVEKGGMKRKPMGHGYCKVHYGFKCGAGRLLRQNELLTDAQLIDWCKQGVAAEAPDDDGDAVRRKAAKHSQQLLRMMETNRREHERR